MISTSDFRIGMKIAIEGEPYYIIDFLRSQTGRGRANVWTKLKNIKSGAVIERTFASGESFNIPDFAHKRTQYLYTGDEEWYFMDVENYEQFFLNKEQIGEYAPYLKENAEYVSLYFEGIPISIDMPTSVILRIVECEPAVRGDTVSNITKAAKVETGLEVKVPPFIKEGDLIKIDTRTGKYLERAN